MGAVVPNLYSVYVGAIAALLLGNIQEFSLTLSGRLASEGETNRWGRCMVEGTPLASCHDNGEIIQSLHHLLVVQADIVFQSLRHLLVVQADIVFHRYGGNNGFVATHSQFTILSCTVMSGLLCDLSPCMGGGHVQGRLRSEVTHLLSL